MRRVGILYVQPVVSGGDGRAGVSGTGIELAGGDRRRRGSSLGSRSLRFGIDGAAVPDSGADDAGVLEFMIYSCRFLEMCGCRVVAERPARNLRIQG